MKRVKIIIFCVLIGFLYCSCNVQKDTNASYTIRLSEKDALISLAGNNSTNENFVSAFDEAVLLQKQFPNKSFLTLFYNVWKTEKYHYIKLKSIFDIYYGEDIDDSYPNSAAWDIIKLKIEDNVFNTTNIIRSRLYRLGYREMSGKLSKRGFDYRVTVKNVKDRKVLEQMLTAKGELSICGKDRECLSGIHVTDARVKDNELHLSFNREGTDCLSKITENNHNSQVVITFDNQILSTPTISKKITGGLFYFSIPDKTKEDIEILAIMIKSGVLPIQCEILDSK